MALTLKGLPGLEDAEDDSSNIFDTPVVDVSEASENSDAGGDNIFDTPALTQTPVSTEEEMSDATTAVPAQSQNIFAGEGETSAEVAPVVRSVEEVTSGTTIPTVGDLSVVGRPVENEAIGADGGEGRLSDVLRTSPGQASGYYPGTGLVLTQAEANRSGILDYDPFGSGLMTRLAGTNVSTLGPAAGTRPVASGTPTTTTPATSTGPTTIGADATDAEKSQIVETMIDQRLKDALSKNPNLPNETVTGIVDDVFYEIYGPAGVGGVNKPAGATGSQGVGIPAIIPIPGLDPKLAAIITAIGLIRSGGKVSTIDPTNPLGSILDIGKNIFMGPTAPGAPAPGTGTVASTGGLNVGTATPEEIEAAKAEAEARSQQAREEEDARREEENKKQQAAIVLAAQQKKDAEEAKRKAEEDARKAVDEANAQARANIPIIGTPSRIGSGPKGGDVSMLDDEEAVRTPGFIDVTPTPSNRGGQTGTATPSESTSTTSCPSPETPILLPDLKTIPAGELKVGMNVMARLENALVWGDYPVTRVEIVKDQRLKFTFDYGTFICSPTHKFCHNDWQWREASSYSVGDEIQDHKILAIEPDGEGDVVVITVDEAHTYVAGPFLSHNKTTAPIVTAVTPTNTTTPTTTTTPGGVNIMVTGEQTPITYTAPTSKAPAQRSTFEEASKQIGALKAKTGRQLLGYEMGPDNKLVPVYSSPTGETTVAEDVVSGYGKTARGMTQEDLQNLFASIEAQTGISQDKLKGEGGYQGALTKAAADQTRAANRALREGNLADAAQFGMEARRLREMANPELYGETGALPQFTRAAQGQVTRDIEALRAAERGELSPEAIRTAQQSAREAFAARGRVMDRGAVAQEVLNREAAVQQRQQLARQNLAQSMGQLGQGIGYQTSNVFDPMAAALGQQYGMQTSNVGLNQALYNQAMGMASGQGGYGFAQQLYNPFSNYAADVYGTNVNAINAAQIAEANRLASLEAARMGEAAARNAANTQMAMGGVDFLYKLGLGKGWWG